jgi:hypothetical protein
LGCVWFSFLKAEAEPFWFSFSAAALKKLLFYSTNLKLGCTKQLFQICQLFHAIHAWRHFFLQLTKRTLGLATPYASTPQPQTALLASRLRSTSSPLPASRQPPSPSWHPRPKPTRAAPPAGHRRAPAALPSPAPPTPAPY